MTSQSQSYSSMVRAIVIDGDHAELDQTKKVLESTQRIEICAETTSFTLAASQIERHEPEFVFLAIGADRQSAYSTIKKIRTNHPYLRIICIGQQNESDLILNCFRAGADEFLLKPLATNNLAEVLQRLADHPKIQKAETRTIGKVIAVWGSRGGSGVTTLASNLAITLAETKSTVLVDLNENQGDLALFFDIQPKFSLQDIWGSGERIDAGLVDSVTTDHDSGLRLLLQSQEQQGNYLNADDVAKLMLILREQYEYVVLDIGHDYELTNMLLPYNIELFLVVNQNIPSLFLASQKRKWLEEQDFSMKNLHLVLNNYNRRSSVTSQHITKGVGMPLSIYIRQDEKAVQSAMNQGMPLKSVAKRGKVTADIEKMAKKLMKQQVDEEQQKQKGLVMNPFFSKKQTAEI
jgi:pilus assembly protein CpaE